MPDILWSKPLAEITPTPPGALTATGDTRSTVDSFTVGPLRKGTLTGVPTEEFSILGGVRAGAYGASSARDELWSRKFSGQLVVVPTGPNEAGVVHLTPFARGIGASRLERRVPGKQTDYLLVPAGGPPTGPEKVFDALYDTNLPTSTRGWLSLICRSTTVPGFLNPTLLQWSYGQPLGALNPHSFFLRALFQRWLAGGVPPVTPGTATSLKVKVKIELGPPGGPASTWDYTQEDAALPAIAPPTVPAVGMVLRPPVAFGATPITTGAPVPVPVGMPVELRVSLEVQIIVTTFVLPPAALCFAAPGLSSEVELIFDETQAPTVVNHLSVGFTVT